jgi:hypothetical protein
MKELLLPYLLVNERLGIPGLGLFQLIKDKPSVNWAQKSVSAPATQISFSTETVEADHQFYKSIAAQFNITEFAAIQLFTDYTYELKIQLQQGGVLLPGFGTLLLNPDGEVLFRPLQNNMALQQTLSFQQIKIVSAKAAENIPSRQPILANIPAVETNSSVDEVSDEMIQKDRWWIYAIILTIIGIAALVIALM